MVSSQQDYPEIIGGRELVITTQEPPTSSKPFHEPNRDFAGDRVSDTPAACDEDAFFWPSSATIAGCLDNDPNTPCINGCTDFDPNTPCLTGCLWDYVNCKYVGDYRDYNYDLISDANEILVKNYMSYTGFCRENFTPGQIARADQVCNFYLNDYYEEELCGTLGDRVEIEGSSTGLNRVLLHIFPTDDPDDYTKTIVNTTGDFYGKLTSLNVNVEVKANAKRYKTTDVTAFDDDWLYGLTTFDLVVISRHILGLELLPDGYKMLAADANKSNTITTYDLVEFRKLILGIYQKLPVYDQPWRFIPEMVTQLPSGGSLQPDFDGGGNDNPFSTTIQLTGQTADPLQYCEPNWPFKMKVNTVRNGFDAVKLGNVTGGYPISPTGECPGDVAMVVPNVGIGQGQTVDLEIKGYNFQSVGAFQIGLKISKDDFEYVETSSENLTEFSEEDGVGGLSMGQNDLKFIWISNNLNPKTLNNGEDLLKITLLAKQNIADLSQAISLDDQVLETYFLTSEGSCKSNTSLQINAIISEGDRNTMRNPKPSSKLQMYCIPNPASDRATLLFDSERAFESNINIFDNYGNLLHRIPCQLELGRNIISLQNFAQLPAGTLHISIYDGHENRSVKILKE